MVEAVRGGWSLQCALDQSGTQVKKLLVFERWVFAKGSVFDSKQLSNDCCSQNSGMEDCGWVDAHLRLHSAHRTLLARSCKFSIPRAFPVTLYL